MARARLTLNPENASIKELKEAARVGSSETATRCMAIQMLLAGAERQLVCDALVVTLDAPFQLLRRGWHYRKQTTGENRHHPRKAGR